MSEPLWKQHFGNIVTGYDPVEAQGLSELGFALKNGLIPEDQYLVWARNTFGALSLDMKFFQEQKAPRSLYEKLKESYSWSLECQPVAEWDEHLIVAGLEKPADLPPDLKVIFVFAPLAGLQSFWEALQTEAPVLAEGETPAEHEEATGLPDGFAMSDSTSTSLSFTGITLAGESKPAPQPATPPAPAPAPSATEKPLLMKMHDEPAEEKPVALKVETPAPPAPKAAPQPTKEKPALVKAEPVVLSPKLAPEAPAAQAIPTIPAVPPPPPQAATPAASEKPKITLTPVEVAQDFPQLPPLPNLPPLPKIPAAPPTETEVASIPTLPKLPPSAPTEETPVPTHVLPKLPNATPSEVAVAPAPALPKLPPTPPPPMAAPQEPFPEVKTVIAAEVRAEPQVVVPVQPSAPRVEIPEALALEALEHFKNHYEKRVFIDFNSQAKTAKAIYWPQDFVATEAPSVHSLETDSFLSIVMKTQKPYHGYLIKNAIVERFFRELNQNEIPENVTVVPLICNDDVVGAVAGWGPKMTYNLNVLRDVQKAAHEMSVKLGWAFSDAA